MGCTNSRERDIEKYIRQRFTDTVDKISPEELNILKIIFFDLALRSPHKKIEKETFFLFFQKNGLWGNRLFKEFDIDNTDFVCLEEFIFSTAKIIKADQQTKIGLLYEFFAFGNQDKKDGIVFSDFVRVLYNYSKQELKTMLQVEYLIDDQLRQQLINVLEIFQKTHPDYDNDEDICVQMKQKTQNIFQSNIYEVLGQKDLNNLNYNRSSLIGKPSNSNHNLQVQLQKNNSTNQKSENSKQGLNIETLLTVKQEDGRDKSHNKNKKGGNKYRTSGMFLELNNKKVFIKTVSYHAIVKKVAGLIFNYFKIDKKQGRLFEDQFSQWIKLHKSLYESYYRGFNQHVWEMKDGKLRYLNELSEIESTGIYIGQIFLNGQKVQKNMVKNCRVFLQNSILFISEEQNKAHIFNIIYLQGLQVSKAFSQKLGFGFEIKHKNNIYPKKEIYFKSETIFKKWMQHLKDFKGFNLHEKYEVGMQIGAGKYSVVYECKQRKNKKRYAMKQIDFFRLASQQKSIISHESQIMGLLNHPNLLKFRESIKTKNKIYIITQLVEGKSLQEYIKQNKQFQQHKAASIAKQIIYGVDYLHSLGIMHRDLKPENIMIYCNESDQIKVKIIDFGFANYIKNFLIPNQDDAIVGTPNYIAPEVYQKKKNTEKCDNFSIGIIIYFMLSGKLPFNSDNLEFLIERTLTQKCQFIGKKWSRVSSEAKHLIERLVQINVEKRISLKEALNHQWFKNHQSLSINQKIVNQSKQEKQSLRNSRRLILY